MNKQKFEQILESIPRANDGLLVLAFMQEVEATKALEVVRVYGSQLQQEYDQHAAVTNRMRLEILRRMRERRPSTKKAKR